MKRLADNIKRARKQAGISAEQAAQRCGVARVTWFAYERGSRTPSVGALLRIAHGLGTTAAALLRGVVGEEVARD